MGPTKKPSGPTGLIIKSVYIAADKQLIKDVNKPVSPYVWLAELSGIKDWADRPPLEGDIDDWKNSRQNLNLS